MTRGDKSPRSTSKDYSKLRYSRNPELHEKDKLRYRKYVAERRKDPEYRRIENERRKERRRQKREALQQKTASKDDGTTAETAKPPAKAKRQTRQSAASAQNDSTNDISLMQKEDDTQPCHLSDLSNGSANSIEVDVDYPNPEFIHRLEQSLTAEKPMNALSISTCTIDSSIPMTSPAASAEDIPVIIPLKTCYCDISEPIGELSTLYEKLAPLERHKLEIGLRLFVKDFVTEKSANTSSSTDTFMLFMWEKLKQVSEDIRPDLEVTIHKAINDALKGNKK